MILSSLYHTTKCAGCPLVSGDMSHGKWVGLSTKATTCSIGTGIIKIKSHIRAKDSIKCNNIEKKFWPGNH